MAVYQMAIHVVDPNLGATLRMAIELSETPRVTRNARSARVLVVVVVIFRFFRFPIILEAPEAELSHEADAAGD